MSPQLMLHNLAGRPSLSLSNETQVHQGEELNSAHTHLLTR